MAPIEAVYENGVFRPLHPVAVPDGTHVELLVVRQQDDTSQAQAVPLVGEQLAALLDEIADLPYTPHADGRTDISIEHDGVLYPDRGVMP